MQVILDSWWQLTAFVAGIAALIIVERVLRKKAKAKWLQIVCCVLAVLGAAGLFVFLIYIGASLQLILAFMLVLALVAVA